MLPGIMLKLVQTQISTMETQKDSMNVNFALDYALSENLVINASKRCPKSVTDCEMTHTSRHRLHHEAPKLTQRTSYLLQAEPENGKALSWRTLHRTHWFLLAQGIVAMCAKTLHQRVVRWIGFETPSARDRPALIHLCPCASDIRCYMSRIV